MRVVIRPSGSLLRGTLWVMVLVAAIAVPVGAAVASGDDRAPSPTRARPAVGHTIADWVWHGVVLDPPRRLDPTARHRVGQELGRQVMERLVGHGVVLRGWALEDLAVEIARRAARHLVDELEDEDRHHPIGLLEKELAAHLGEWAQGIDLASGPVAADPAPPTPEPDPVPPPASVSAPPVTAGGDTPEEVPGESRAVTDPRPSPPRDLEEGAPPGPSLPAAGPRPVATTTPRSVPIAGRFAADVGSRARPGVITAAVRIGAEPLSLPAAAIGIFGLGLVATSRVGRPSDGGDGLGGRRGRGRPFR